ncbi:GUstatory Receptor family [Ditylenchus destructor]|nr:GUstatory Receptor family [Ditylenchus destructor]
MLAALINLVLKMLNSNPAKCHVLLPTDVLSEICRYFTRKELCQTLYFVNNQFHRVASSTHHVPVFHVVQELCIENVIWSYDIEDFPSSVPIASQQYDFTVCFGNLSKQKFRRLPVNYFVREVPLPRSWIRFREVILDRLPDESMIEFLRSAKESFVGCKLVYNYLQLEQLLYLIENFFSTNLKLVIWNCSEACNNALLDWLKHCSVKKSDSSEKNAAKYLLLANYSRTLILNLVQQIRQDFIDATVPALSNFVVTFYGSRNTWISWKDRLVLPGRSTFQDYLPIAAIAYSLFTIHRMWTQPGRHSIESLNVAFVLVCAWLVQGVLAMVFLIHWQRKGLLQLLMERVIIRPPKKDDNVTDGFIKIRRTMRWMLLICAILTMNFTGIMTTFVANHIDHWLELLATALTCKDLKLNLPTHLLDLFHVHKNLANKIQLVDTTFQAYTSVNMSIGMSTTVLALIVFIRRNTFLGASYSLNDTACCTFQMLALTVVPAQIYTEFRSAHEILYRNSAIWVDYDTKLYLIGRMFAKSAVQNNIGITLGGFIPITKSLILTSASLVLPYVLLCIQLQVGSNYSVLPVAHSDGHRNSSTLLENIFLTDLVSPSNRSSPLRK